MLNPITFYKNIITRSYNYMMNLAAKKNAAWFLGMISFIESSFFPIPPDLMLIPMTLAKPKKAWYFASICMITSVIGGFFGYFLGSCFYDIIAEPLLEFYGYMEKFEHFKSYYSLYGIWIVLFAGFTPFPNKVITITSGVMGLNLFIFFLASIIARGGRFFLVAALLYKFGTACKTFIEKRLGLLSFIFFILLIGSFYVIKYL
jgi:membrane protein YqaA with SNARE-associated domain